MNRYINEFLFDIQFNGLYKMLDKMSLELNELKVKLEFMQNNISEINLYLEECKQKDHKCSLIPQKVIDLNEETTKCAKEVSKQLKELFSGTHFDEMPTNRLLLMNFLSILSDLSSLQRHIIDNSVINTDCVDCGGNTQTDRTNSRLSNLLDTNKPNFWYILGMCVISGTAIYKALH